MTADGTDKTTTGGDSANGPFARLGADLDIILRNLIPSEEAIDHFSRARIEVLKGVRSLIDARIDRLSADTKKGVAVEIE
jgi:hypothetical protein